MSSKITKNGTLTTLIDVNNNNTYRIKLNGFKETKKYNNRVLAKISYLKNNKVSLKKLYFKYGKCPKINLIITVGGFVRTDYRVYFGVYEKSGKIYMYAEKLTNLFQNYVDPFETNQQNSLNCAPPQNYGLICTNLNNHQTNGVKREFSNNTLTYDNSSAIAKLNNAYNNQRNLSSNGFPVNGYGYDNNDQQNIMFRNPIHFSEFKPDTFQFSKHTQFNKRKSVPTPMDIETEF